MEISEILRHIPVLSKETIFQLKVSKIEQIPADNEFHPEAGHFGKVVWISEDGKTVAIQCERRHNGKIIALMVRICSKE